MPEFPFVQVMAASALAAVALAVFAMPVGARVGARAGLLVLRGSLVGVIAVFAACLAWGASSGDLGRFNAQMGTSAWLQMAAFFSVAYGTAYRFAWSYLTDKLAARAKEAADD